MTPEMERAIEVLNKQTEKIDTVVTYRRIPLEEFSKENLIKIISVVMNTVALAKADCEQRVQMLNMFKRG